MSGVEKRSVPEILKWGREYWVSCRLISSASAFDRVTIAVVSSGLV